MRFSTPVQTVNAGHNPKYFKSGRGITCYNFTSDQFSGFPVFRFSGFHNIVIPGTLRDSIYILEGLLEHQTDLNPLEIMADTAGASDIVFWLLGFQFSPRLADAGESRFRRIDNERDYGEPNNIGSNKVDYEHIVQNWDEMLRIIGSLKLGTISASELIRSLLKSKKPSGIARAFQELGRIPKTIYLLNYIDDENYRRKILTQLNRGESRHSVARAVCHGQLGEIRKRYRDGQESQLGALGLVVNAIVHWNTCYIQAALDHLYISGNKVSDDDKARLSPLQHKNINFIGRYSFALDDSIKKGELRPLRIKEEED